MRAVPIAAQVAVALAIAGCESLLPIAKSEVKSPWKSFDDAKLAIERIVPERTTAADLKASGIDPYTSPNVQLLSYSDVLLRFPANSVLAQGTLDSGLRECLASGKACTGYSITVRDVKRERVGNFWKDSLGFRREVEITGWSFNALILLVGDRVVYTLYGGQPLLSEQEMTRNPLGPIQDWAGAVGSAFKR
jgi:hypothetical protein